MKIVYEMDEIDAFVLEQNRNSNIQEFDDVEYSLHRDFIRFKESLIDTNYPILESSYDPY